MRQVAKAAIGFCAVVVSCAVPSVTQAQLDNYHCFKVKDLKSPEFEETTVSLAGIPSTVDAELKKPVILCVPTSANGSGINDPFAVTCCYKAKGETFPANSRPVFPVTNAPTTNQNVKLQLRKTAMFCEPCSGAFALP